MKIPNKKQVAQKVFNTSSLRKEILRARRKAMLKKKQKEIAAKKIQKARKEMIYRRQYKQGYRYLNYDDVYNKIYHCPVYYYEWDTNSSRVR